MSQRECIKPKPEPCEKVGDAVSKPNKFNIGDYYLGKYSNMVARITNISKQIELEYSDDVIGCVLPESVDRLYTKLENPEIGEKYSCKSDGKE